LREKLKIAFMRRVVLTIVLSIAVVMLLDAQNYKTGIGLRVGTGTGLTLKHFINSKSAIEGLLVTKWQGFDFAGLYELHNQPFDVDNLDWFYGFGAHIGFYDGHNEEWGIQGPAYSVLGIDGIVGLEYTFMDAPVNLGLDFKPVLNLTGYSGLWAEFGFSVRYVF
jgi:hypothetical protein